MSPIPDPEVLVVHVPVPRDKLADKLEDVVASISPSLPIGVVVGAIMDVITVDAVRSAVIGAASELVALKQDGKNTIKHLRTPHV